MAIFKCKMCGGTIEFEEGATVGTCDSCGTKQTLPKTNDEAIKNLFNRATNLRLKCEFDKAEQIYEKIVQQDDSEAEAHWGIVLCKYGIEYVEDPKTFTRIPTCHRTLFEAVTTDPDYIAAIDYSDASQQAIYEAEARAIDKIQKDILAIVKNEKPFDVFICYKETDEDGKRTIDSTIANDIYYQLTQEGFKVFYAAITLEDKLGKEYEPYIFAALNSSKVMLVLGTKPEYFSAVWVKNEWSRFMNFMKTDRSKLLIPCYRDMDAYDLPEEFAHLQAQDMSKIGFINDVVRGIKKVVNKEEAQETVKETIVVNNTTNSNTEPLLKRAFMFLEDGEWEKADDFCEQVLNINPEEPRAYLGKLMAELKIKKEDKLKGCLQSFDSSNNYQKAYRFADDSLKTKLNNDIKFINERNEETRKENTYINAGVLGESTAISQLNKAIELYESIKEYKDTEEKINNCKIKIKNIEEKNERIRIEGVYAEAQENENIGDLLSLRNAVQGYESITEWKDSKDRSKKCKKRIAELEEKNSKTMKITAILLTIVMAIIVFLVVLTSYIIPNSKYNDAMKMYEEEKYDEAIGVLESVDESDYDMYYAEICAKIEEAKYNKALKLYSEGKCKEALLLLETLTYSGDVESKIEQIRSDKRYFAEVKAQETILFGEYNNKKIEWIVLEQKDNKCLVVSAEIIAKKKYHDYNENITWEKCTLRKWLNRDFIYSAFSDDEKRIIAETTNVNKNNPSTGTNGGNDTKDNVFLLSIDEVSRYLNSEAERKCRYNMDDCSWWLRSPGQTAKNVAIITSSGSLNYRDKIGSSGEGINYEIGVRPAMWITLD